MDVYLAKPVSRSIVPLTDVASPDTKKLSLTPVEPLEYMEARTIVEKYQGRFKYKRKYNYDNPHA